MTVVSVFVITPEGRLTSVMNPCSTACALIAQTPAAILRILLDLQGVTFLDASGVAFIAALYRAARGRGGELRLVEVDGTSEGSWRSLGSCKSFRSSVPRNPRSRASSTAAVRGCLERAKVLQHPGGFRWAGSAH